MPSLLSSLGIDHLSVSERIQLVQEIWDSLAPFAEELPVSEAQRQELDRRLATLAVNPDNVIPWEEVEARPWRGSGNELARRLDARGAGRVRRRGGLV